MIETAHENYETARTKECSKCKEIKSFSEFSKQRDRKFGLASNCKECHNKRGKKYYQENKEKIKQYLEVNKEKISSQKREYYQKNKERISEYYKKYYQKNKEKFVETNKQYRQNNFKKMKESKKQWCLKNKEKISIYMKQYQEKNKEKITKQRKQYYQNNKERIKVYHKKRRELLSNSFPESFEDKCFCQECNNELTIYQIISDQFYCSSNCFGVAQRKSETQVLRKKFRGYNWQFKRKIIRERDNYICQICGEEENGREHDVHHIVPYHSFEDKLEANRNDNLITLCQSCHIRYEDRVDLMLYKISDRTIMLRKKKQKKEEEIKDEK